MKKFLHAVLVFYGCLCAVTGVRAADEYYDLPLTELLHIETPAKANIGSRSGARVALGASVPVDVITANQLQSVGQTELARALAMLMPGFNYPRPSIADGTDHAPPFTLRALNPDQVLVLVNGKRLHQSSLLNINGTIGRGSSGVDLNSIPLHAVERVEVLRDGAAAQYGSDAIAGVINIVLKGYGFASEANVSYGRADAGDGITRQADVFYSLPLAEDGFLNLTAEWRDRGETNRAGPDLLDGGRVNTHFGDAEAEDIVLALNAEIPVNDTVYFAHGHFNRRDSSAGAFYRRANDGRNIPEIYPAGFLPRIEPEIKDYSLTGGVRGFFNKDTYWELSYTQGGNDFHFYVNNSLNRSLGLATPTSFDSGATNHVQKILNLDVTRKIGEHSLAGGYEYRHEEYRIRKGDVASWILGEESEWYAGAQGFSGFSPDNEIDANRESHAGYVDLKYAISKKMTFVSALRFENFSDFGSTFKGKLGLRYRPIEQVTLRTSISNGFRAPSLSQAYFNSTAMIRNSDVISRLGVFAVDHPVARALGSRSLKPEKTEHATIGVVYQPSNSLMLSLDLFTVEIDDRIMLTSYIAGWNLETLSPEAEQILAQNQVESAVYLTNAISTHTHGLDARMEYKAELAKDSRWSLTAAYQRASTHIDDINSPPSVLGVDMSDLVLDRFTLVTIEKGQPSDSLKLWSKYSWSTFDWVVNANRFGSFYSTMGDDVVRFSARWTADTELAWHVTKSATLALGSTNIFNIKPQEWGQTDDTLSGSGKVIRYSQYSPFGFNGTAYFIRLNMTF